MLVALVAGCSSGSGSHTAAAPTASPPAATVSAAPTSAAPTAAPQSAVAAESNPPGDIPDNLAFIPYSNTAGRYRFTHPEGWAEKTQGSTATFTDKLNGVQAATGTATTPPTLATAKQQDVPELARSQAAFELRTITDVSMPAGRGVRIVYRRNSAPDAVTGRQYRDEVERYELVSHGREVIVELFGPVGADNVDAYKTMIDSLKIQ
ncbi:lipoprotein [Krasilnikovia sp. MM14-A1004]